MFKQFVAQLPDSEIYAIVSLLLFFLVFLGVIYKTIRTDKNYIKKMERLPLDASQNNGDPSDG